MLRPCAALWVCLCLTVASSCSAAAGQRVGRDLPVWSIADARGDHYLSAHGLRAFAGGYSEDGLEVWTPPLQLASGYAIDFVRTGADAVSGIAVLSSAKVDPLGVTRHYSGAGFEVRERIETRTDLSGVRVRFEVRGPADVQVRVRLRPSLDLMWPAAIGGQEFAWDGSVHGFLLKEPTDRFHALIASPQATMHTEPNNDRRGSTFGREIVMTLAPVPCGATRCATLVFAGGSEPGEDVHATARALLQAPDTPASDDVRRFDATRTIAITTPDAGANRALQWAQVALEQAWTCNPRLGCGLVAGYGPSHGARRPQYMWYFGGDGLVATRALLHTGDFARAAQELDFIYRYQHPGNGMIWHEMSQSAAFLDWANGYPYMYAHVDIAFDFISVLAEFDRATGDQAFLARHWPQTRKAYDYCLSTLDAQDGLPRVPAGKMSANEQDALTDELTLSAAWVEASQAMSSLATAMGDTALATQARTASERARASLRARYRDVAGRRWISGFSRAGKPADSFSGADMAAIMSGAATEAETAATLDRLGMPAYLTAWGLRSKPSDASDYDPAGYGKGSVWGLGTAGAAESLWRARRPQLASRLWRSLVPWASLDSPGHMHEVMRGDAYVPQRESVPEQTWSSAAFLSAAVGGMLGLDVDARMRVLHFAPRPPADWRSLKVERVRVGTSVVDLDWRRETGGASLAVRNAGPVVHLVWMQDGKVVEHDIAAGNTRLVAP